MGTSAFQLSFTLICRQEEAANLFGLLLSVDGLCPDLTESLLRLVLTMLPVHLSCLDCPIPALAGRSPAVPQSHSQPLVVYGDADRDTALKSHWTSNPGQLFPCCLQAASRG